MIAAGMFFGLSFITYKGAIVEKKVKGVAEESN